MHLAKDCSAGLHALWWARPSSASPRPFQIALRTCVPLIRSVAGSYGWWIQSWGQVPHTWLWLGKWHFSGVITLDLLHHNVFFVTEAFYQWNHHHCSLIFWLEKEAEGKISGIVHRKEPKLWPAKALILDAADMDEEPFARSFALGQRLFIPIFLARFCRSTALACDELVC